MEKFTKLMTLKCDGHVKFGCQEQKLLFNFGPLSSLLWMLGLFILQILHTLKINFYKQVLSKLNNPNQQPSLT